MRTSRLSKLALCTTLAAGGCGSKGEEFTPSPPFDDKENVKAWAGSSSAVAIYSNVYRDIAVFDGEQSYPDAECPLLEDDGTTWTATGGCTDSEGDELKGALTIERDGDDRLLTYDGFRENVGSFSLKLVEAGLHEFEAKLVLGGFTTVDYRGSVQGGYDERTIWNGSGTIVRDGFVPPNGEIEANTLNEIVDNDVCAGQPVSGSTTLKSGEDVAVITYDGEDDCDEEKNALLTVNDEDRGTIDGINCSVAAPGGGAAKAWLLALGLVAARLRRRSAAATQ